MALQGDASMIRYVHSNPKFEKMLAALRTSEKMAVAAAKKADEIIENIIRKGVDTPLTELGKMTRHGEFRIKNCVKFDLGKGHRLVCVKDDDCLHLLFVGTHDACSAWVENNRTYEPDPHRSTIITPCIIPPPDSDTQGHSRPSQEPDYEDLLLEKITEKELRIVFNGLINPVDSQSMT